MKKILMFAALVGASLAAGGAAEAGVLGRHLGLCWGDGYHAKCDCGHGHRWLGCGLFNHGCGDKGKCAKGGALPVTAEYPAAETIAPDEIPMPAMNP